MKRVTVFVVLIFVLSVLLLTGCGGDAKARDRTLEEQARALATSNSAGAEAQKLAVSVMATQVFGNMSAQATQQSVSVQATAVALRATEQSLNIQGTMTAMGAEGHYGGGAGVGLFDLIPLAAAGVFFAAVLLLVVALRIHQRPREPEVVYVAAADGDAVDGEWSRGGKALPSGCTGIVVYDRGRCRALAPGESVAQQMGYR